VKVITRGPEPYRVAVVCCLHGDEHSGKVATTELLEELETFQQGVKFVVANEAALDRGERYVDEDLNRVFPGDRTADSHERRLAAELLEELRGLDVLDLHETVSSPTPVALVDGLSETSRRLSLATGVPNVADLQPESGERFFPGSLLEHVRGVAVECGLRGRPETVRNAKRAVRTFLATRGIVPAEVEYPSTVSVFRLFDRVTGTGYAFAGTNFELVATGEVYAEANGEELVADRPFYPVLMSTDGYDDLLGYRAEKLCEISADD